MRTTSLKDRPVRDAIAVAGLALAAAVCSNLTAGPERRLDWVRRRPAASLSSRTAVTATPASRPAQLSTPAAVARPATPASTPPARVAAKPAGPGAPPPKESAAPTAAPEPPQSAARFPPHPDKPWIEITSEEAKTLFDRGALFLDARRSSVYRDGHIRAARSVSVWEAGLDDKLAALAAEGRDPGSPVVSYCSGGDCEDSHQLAERLWGIGWNAVFVYRGGFPDWQSHSWPANSGTTP